VFRRLVGMLDPNQMRGRVLAVPVGNPHAFQHLTRNTPDESDEPDLNRVFPGHPRGTLSQRLACVLSDIVSQVDCVIDFHCGPLELATNHVLVPDFEGEYGRRVMHLSQVYGLEILHLGSAYGGSLSSHAATLGVPAIVAEVGGGPTLEDGFVDVARRGVFNIMKDLGMIAAKPVVPAEQTLVKEMSMLRIGHGGLFYPAVRLSQLGQIVPLGTPLGRVISTCSLKELETLRAPYERTLLILVRDALSRVQPGDFAYFLGNMGSSETIRRDGVVLPS